MHLNPYGEYAVLLAASLANDWPADRDGIVSRTRDFGMTMEFPAEPGDHARLRAALDEWLEVVDAADGPGGRASSTGSWRTKRLTPISRTTTARAGISTTATTTRASRAP